jgi:hypothetical protein
VRRPSAIAVAAYCTSPDYVDVPICCATRRAAANRTATRTRQIDAFVHRHPRFARLVERIDRDV